MTPEEHRQLQLRVRALTLRQLLSLWPSLDVARLEETWPTLRAALISLILLRRGDSAGIASSYYREARLAAGVLGRAPVKLATPDPAYLGLSLDVVGLFGARHLLAQGRKDVLEQTLVKVSGAVGRHVLNAGRDTVAESLHADPKATGWRRTIGGKPCAFCSMLAGRGAVYSKGSVDFAAHDHCSCGIAPVWGEQPTRDVRDYAPSTRHITSEERLLRNERVRAFIAANSG